MPSATSVSSELVKAGFPYSGWKIHTSKWVVSLLKAWYGEAANADNDFAPLLPKRDASRIIHI